MTVSKMAVSCRPVLASARLGAEQMNMREAKRYSDLPCRLDGGAVAILWWDVSSRKGCGNRQTYVAESDL